jgi:PAS domain S-box-containing protein
MSAPLTHAALRRTLRRQQTELQALRAQLPAPTTPTPTSSLAGFLAHLQEIFPAIILVDPQRVVTWVSPGFAALCGCAVADLVGRHPGLVLGCNRLDLAEQARVTGCLNRGETFEYEITSPHPDRPGRWLRVKAQAYRNQQHELEAFIGMAEDITAEKNAQLVLAENEARYRELAEQVPGILYRWRKKLDGTFTLLYVSPKMQELIGVQLQEGADFYPFVHPEDQARYLASIAVATGGSTPRPWNFEGRLLVPERPLIWWRGNATLSYQDAQGIVYSGIIEDITSIKHAEEAARYRQLRQVMAVEGLGDGSWEYNCQTQTTAVSAELKILLGYAPDEHANAELDWENYTHPDDVPAVGQQWQDFLAGRVATFHCERRLLCKDGTYRWVLNRALVTKRDEQGRMLLVTGSNIDISASKGAESTLKALTLRLSTTITNLQRGVLLVDENQRVVLANNTFCQLFDLQLPPEHFTGMLENEVVQRIKSQFPNEEAFIAYEENTVRNHRSVTSHVMTLRDGRIIQCSFIPVDHDHMDIGHLWKFEDITARYQAEQQLKRQEEKYRNIIDNMQLGLVEMDLNYRVLYANRSYCQMVGYSPAELLHQPLHHLLLSTTTIDALRERLPDRERGISGSYELEIMTKQGERKWLFVGAGALYDENKNPTGTIGINLDITHQKHLEQNLREAKKQAEDSAKAKELFLANMSHEIRTPMNAIMGMSQLLAKTELAPAQNSYLHAITTSAQNLLVIINDILDISKLDAGKMGIEQVGFNVFQLCEQVEKTMLYKAEEKGLRFVTRVDPLIPNVVLGDPYRITQILLNLASNSLKFTEKGEVLVECELAGYLNGQVIVAFSVCDTGVGIDPKYLKSIFQEFSQEDTSVTRKYGGTGLGLSISRSLARLMGGEIYIESEKGKGTSSHFCLFLPVGTVHDLPQRKSLAITNPQELRGKRVLLVEDNEYNRLLAKTFLANAHLDVTEAENGELALACVQEQPAFDLILMDVQMPVMDGFETTRYLRQTLGLTTPIIALTASAINGEKQKCLAVGMNDYLTKPFYENELLQLVHDWIIRPQGSAPTPTVEAPAAPAVAPPTADAPLYKLDILLDTARGNQKFVASMLQTFIDSTYNALRELNRALEMGDLPSLQATAHKLRPSLVHLQILPAVTLLDTLENWPGAFSYDDLQPLVETSDRLLRQVLADIAAELQTRRAATEG